MEEQNSTANSASNTPQDNKQGGSVLARLRQNHHFRILSFLFVAAVFGVIGAYLFRNSFASTKPVNPYSCARVDGKFVQMGLGDKDPKDANGKLIPNKQCIHAVQWAFKTQAGQSQITVNGTFDDATKKGAMNFQAFFRYKPVDGTLTSNQLAAIAYMFGTLNAVDIGTAAWEPTYPGQPRPGKVYWGSSKTGNGDVTGMETTAGSTLGTHRTFFTANPTKDDPEVTSAVNVAKADIANGRLPMVSFKPPASWTDMANGKQKAWVDDMLTKLDAVGGPVWLAMNHEPEGPKQVDDPGGPIMHVAMNRYVRGRMTALGTKNISLNLVLMAYTWLPASGQNPEDWYADGIYDHIGIDTYWLDDDVYWKDNASKGTLLETTKIKNIRTFAYKKGKDVAIYEYGFGRLKTAMQATRLQEFYNGILAAPPVGQARIVAATYFNSNLNGGTELDFADTNDLSSKYLELMRLGSSTHWRDEKAGASL